MNWELRIAMHWPHHRFAIGWDILHPDEKYEYSTFILYLFIVTFTLDVYN